jgi:hypothetical protein
MATIRKITIHNKLEFDVKNFEVLCAASMKFTSSVSVLGLDYVFDWRTVDVENGDNVNKKEKIFIGDVAADSQTSVYTSLKARCDLRSYWQVYWDTKSGNRYKLDKNNAQCNVWEMDDGREIDIFLISEANRIRVDFLFPSGRAYFYTKTY